MFIVFEGIDGSGKSTQSKRLAKRLEEEGYPIHFTFEPTNNFIGKEIRRIFQGNEPAIHEVIAGLFVADRLDHILHPEYGMKKALENGKIVISDRYVLSSYAYQGAHLGLEWVMQANSLSAKLLKPDLQIYIDITPETALQRLKKGRENFEIFETEQNLIAVYYMFQKILDQLKDSEHIVIIDGNKSEDEIHHEIYLLVKKLIKS